MKKHLKDNSLFGTGALMEEHPDLFKFLERSKPTDYDKIMDRVYADTHIGGGTHRHFDGSHTLHGSWEKISAERGDVDLYEYLKAHANEFVTPEGIPLMDLDNQSHHALGHEVSEALGGVVSPGAIKSYIRDFNSVNAPEFAGASLGGIFQFMANKSGNPKAISRVTASNLTLGLLTGNPIQIAVGLTGLGHGIYNNKIQAFELLKGSLPIVSGAITLKLGKEVLGLGSSTSLLASIATTVGTNIAMNAFEERKLKQAQEELGGDPRYLLIMSPEGLKKELEIFELKNGSKIDVAI